MTKAASVGVGAVFAVGLMGMAQASGEHREPESSAKPGSNIAEHDHGTLGSPDTARFTTQQTDRVQSFRALPRLRGKVDADRNLTLSRTNVASGRYRIVVRDSTRRHNWHIFGDGVDKATKVRGTGRWVWRVRLRDGRYTVVCDPHADTMRFRVNVS